MPIEVTSRIEVFDQEAFHGLDKKLMRIVFDVHNKFGRFFDETLYKSEIAARWINAGFGTAEREVRITAKHGTFQKDYLMDILFNAGLMLEAKTTEILTPNHRTYGLNYLFLTGMRHGRLVNLRPERVQHEFLSTRLTAERRHEFTIDDSDWKCLNPESSVLKDTLVDLLKDWGAFLEAGLYKEAVTHFLGGTEKVVRFVPIVSAGRTIGEQKLHLLNADTAFSFTSVVAKPNSMMEHQRRFLEHTPLRFIQWVNFRRHRIEFRTLRK
jgi:GxxExxY protein